MIVALFYYVAAKVFYSNDFVLSNTCGMPFVTKTVTLTHSLLICLTHSISILGKPLVLVD